MSEQVPTKKKVPAWVYAVIIAIGPVVFSGCVILAWKTLAAIFNLLGRFDYWWVIGVTVLYLIYGSVLAGAFASWWEKE